MSKQKRKNKDEQFAEDVFNEVDRIKKLAEQTVMGNIAEMFSPSVKKMIAEAVMGEADDEFEEPSEEDLEDLEDALEEADYSDELEEDDLDMEGLDEAEESEEDFDDMEMDNLDEEEGGEAESSDDFEDLDEEFIRELEAILEGGDDDEDEFDDEDDFVSEALDEADKEELEEDVTGHSYSEKDPKPAMDADPHHDKTGGSIHEKGKKKDKEKDMDEDVTGHSYSEKDPKPAMDADPHTDAFIKENRQLKRMMNKIMRTLNEVTLDAEKTEELKNIFENYEVPEKAKVRVLSAIDKAKTKTEMFAIAEAVKKQYKRKASKRRVNEGVRGSKKIGGNSKIKQIKKGTKGKKLEESISYDFADRLAEIASVKN